MTRFTTGTSVSLAAIPLALAGCATMADNVAATTAAADTTIPRESLSSATTAINIRQRLGGPAGATTLALFP